MKKLELQAVVWKEDKRYVSQCLNIDIASYGDTKAQALKHLREAVELYLENAKVKKPATVTRPSLVSLTLSHA